MQSSQFLPFDPSPPEAGPSRTRSWFGVSGLGCKIEGSEFEVEGHVSRLMFHGDLDFRFKRKRKVVGCFTLLGCRVQGSGFRVQGSGYRVQGTGFRVHGPGFRI